MGNWQGAQFLTKEYAEVFAEDAENYIGLSIQRLARSTILTAEHAEVFAEDAELVTPCSVAMEVAAYAAMTSAP